MDAWVKMPLGMEVGLGPGHVVLDGVPALRQRGTAAFPLFGPCLLWPRSPISATAELLFVFSFFIILFLFGSVRQIKLATRQLSGAR